MKYYLIDTSALVYAFENTGKTKLDFFKEKANDEAFLYIPQFCVTEVLNTFARFFYKNKNIGPDSYTKWRNEFLKSVRNRKILYAYDLHRYHNLNADKVFRFEHKTPVKQKEHYLSTVDILIIAMGMELKKIHCDEEVIIVSRDGRLVRISRKLSVKAVWFE